MTMDISELQRRNKGDCCIGSTSRGKLAGRLHRDQRVVLLLPGGEVRTSPTSLTCNPDQKE